jgi:hypothetical protein
MSWPVSFQALCTFTARASLLKLLPDRLFGKLLRLPSEHRSELFIGLPNLFTHGNQAFGDIVVVFPQEQIGQFNEVYFLERQRSPFRELPLGFDEGVRMFAPMSSREEMMRSVVAVIETVSVCLLERLADVEEW